MCISLKCVLCMCVHVSVCVHVQSHMSLCLTSAVFVVCRSILALETSLWSYTRSHPIQAHTTTGAFFNKTQSSHSQFNSLPRVSLHYETAIKLHVTFSSKQKTTNYISTSEVSIKTHDLSIQKSILHFDNLINTFFAGAGHMYMCTY